MSSRTILSIAAVIIGMGWHPLPAEASTFIYNFYSVLKGAASPSSPPWLTARFTDVAPGKVEMTFTASSLTGRESVKGFYLNLNPALNPCLLVFNRINSAGLFKDPKIGVGSNAFRADGGGKFDIRLQFSDSGGSSRQFGAGDQVTYLISGIPGLTASNFDFTSVPNFRKGPIYSAAQVRGIGPCDGKSWLYPADGFVPVPEPSAPVLFGLVLVVFGALRARRQGRA